MSNRPRLSAMDMTAQVNGGHVTSHPGPRRPAAAGLL
jgi:hypothetical protein